MTVHVVFTGPFRFVTRAKEIDVDLPTGATVAYLVRMLARMYGDQSNKNSLELVFSPPHSMILVNGSVINELNGPETIVRDGSLVVFVTPVGGG